MQWSIDNDFILGSSNPSFKDLQELYSRGYKSIISLLYDNERHNYDKEEAVTLGFLIYSIPIEDFHEPEITQFMDFYDKLHQAQKRGKVLIHCCGGNGRTGTMAAAYWIKKGLSAEEAISKVRKHNPFAIEEKCQENSLYELERTLNEKNDQP